MWCKSQILFSESTGVEALCGYSCSGYSLSRVRFPWETDSATGIRWSKFRRANIADTYTHPHSHTHPYIPYIPPHTPAYPDIPPHTPT